MDHTRISPPLRPYGLALLAFLTVATAGWGKVVYVNKNAPGAVHNGTSWGTAFTTVQAGINAAAAADEIWVTASTPAAPTYVENVTLKAGTGLYGGFAGTETGRDQRTAGANLTTLQAPSTGGSVVFVPAGCGPDTVLDGFTISGGTGIPLSGYPDTPWRAGGGVFCRDASPTISHNTITGNSAKGDLLRSGGGWGPAYAAIGGGEGAGIYCRNSSAVIENNTISSNTAWNGGGGIECFGGSPTISGNVIDHNTAAYPSFTAVYPDAPPPTEGRGGGVYCEDSSAVLRGNSFLSNTASIEGGGLYVYGGSAIVVGNYFSGNYSHEGGGASCYSGTLTGNSIAFNSAVTGGGVLAGGTAAVINCTITGNSPQGVYSEDTASVTNCTLTGNTIGIGGSPSGSPDFTNCIVAFNGTGVSGDPAGNGFSLSHNDVFGNLLADYANITDPTGTSGNIRQDPILSNRYQDVHLQPGSPCIDAGDDSAVTLGQTDAYGKPRIIGSHVDIGSDESDGTTWVSFARTWYVSSTGSDANDGASWGTAKKTITAALSGAHGPDEVWVAKGTYTGNLEMPMGMGLYGGFAGTESSKGQRDWLANPTVLSGVSTSYVVECRTVGNVVNGLTILGNDAIGVSGGPATVSNCTLTGTATGSGTGVYLSGGLVIITDCTITGKTTGLELRGTAKVTNCVIGGCAGTGVYVRGTASISNSIVAFNGKGIALGTDGVSVTLSHNDVYGSTSAAYANYVDIVDPTGTNGNLSTDPLFVDRTNGDLHLLSGSPCIDTGDNAVVTPGDRDLDGKPRIIGAHVDMGAYEFGSGYYTMADATKALRIASGLEAAPSDVSRLNVSSISASIDMLDVVQIARMAAGLHANP